MTNAIIQFRLGVLADITGLAILLLGGGLAAIGGAAPDTGLFGLVGPTASWASVIYGVTGLLLLVIGTAAIVDATGSRDNGFGQARTRR